MKLVAASLLLLASVLPPTVHAQDDPDSATAAVAEAAGVEATDCMYDCAREYIASHSRYSLRAVCVARMESGFDGNAWNPQPVGREHAAGFFGWLPSTARSVNVTIGDLVSEVVGFDRMLDSGRGREYAGIAWGRC